MITSNDALVTHLRQTGVLRSPSLIRAFEAVDRAHFVPGAFRTERYEDHPLPIGFGQTISQPYTVAFMLELLQLRPTDAVLDIGAGSGWTTALMATIARHVTGIERIPQLVSFARSNLASCHFDNAEILSAGTTLGIPGRTFDKILVSAAADQLPYPLLEQLRPNGTLVIPVDHAIVVCQKSSEGEVISHQYEGFVFVPLITADN